MRKDRTCLICEGNFSSPGPHIRKCGNCLNAQLDDEYFDQTVRNWNKNLIYKPKPYVSKKGKRTMARKEEKFW